MRISIGYNTVGPALRSIGYDAARPPLRSIGYDTVRSPLRSVGYDTVGPPLRSIGYDIVGPPLRSIGYVTVAPPLRSPSVNNALALKCCCAPTVAPVCCDAAQEHCRTPAWDVRISATYRQPQCASSWLCSAQYALFDLRRIYSALPCS